MEAANLAFHHTQNMEGSWSISNELYKSQFGEDNPDAKPVESPLYGTQPFEDVVSLLVPLNDGSDGKKYGLRSTATGDYLVVEPKPNPSDTSGSQECVPTYLRVAFMGFDLIQESDLGTPDPSMTGTRTSFSAKITLSLHQHNPHAWLCGLCGLTSVPRAGTCDADHVARGGVLGPPISAVPSNLPSSGTLFRSGAGQ
jgi:hypothetical protein